MKQSCGQREFVKASEAKMDFYSQSLHYGYSVFEGIRSYKTESGERASSKPPNITTGCAIPLSPSTCLIAGPTKNLIDATYEVLRRNNLQDAYIRPAVYAPANMSFVKIRRHSFYRSVGDVPSLDDKLLRIMTSSFKGPIQKLLR